MKKFLVLIAVLGSGGSSWAQTSKSVVPGSQTPSRYIYKASCALASPLGFYEPCEPGYRTASASAHCALNDANTECRADGNRFCESLGFNYKYGMSKEYPGYQYCEVKVTVEGFK